MKSFMLAAVLAQLFGCATTPVSPPPVPVVQPVAHRASDLDVPTDQTVPFGRTIWYQLEGYKPQFDREPWAVNPLHFDPSFPSTNIVTGTIVTHP